MLLIIIALTKVCVNGVNYRFNDAEYRMIKILYSKITMFAISIVDFLIKITSKVSLIENTASYDVIFLLKIASLLFCLQ